MFLRVAKFSQLEALSRLERYLQLFNIKPEFLRDIDMLDPKVQEFLDVGYVQGTEGTTRSGYDKEMKREVGFTIPHSLEAASKPNS